MDYFIKNASIVLGTDEEACGEFGKINIFIGNKSQEAIQALLEATCAVPFSTNQKMRLVNFIFSKNKKYYDVSSISTICGTKALVKYNDEDAGFSKDAFFEYQKLLESFILIGNINIFDNHKKTAMDEHLSQEARTKLNLEEFYELITNPALENDQRPLFLWNVEFASNVLINEFLRKVALLNRQVFIALEKDCLEVNNEYNKIYVRKICDAKDA